MVEGFEAKEYLKAKPINQVREIFIIRTSMTKGFKANFSNQHSDTKCEGCGVVIARIMRASLWYALHMLI